MPLDVQYACFRKPGRVGDNGLDKVRCSRCLQLKNSEFRLSIVRTANGKRNTSRISDMKTEFASERIATLPQLAAYSSTCFMAGVCIR
jgi:hypothetical protein